MWLVGLALMGALVGFLGLSLWQGGDGLLIASTTTCPSCGGTLICQTRDTDAQQWNRSYAFWGCDQCTHAVTRLHGLGSQMAYCVSCRQLEMEVAVNPCTPGPGWTIDETCHICGHHEQVRIVPGDLPPIESRGQVIPFRRR